MYAALASVIDLFQFLLRKLIGLDTFYINGEAVTNQDPVLQFIYGILGIGENAGEYSALQTVFWSLVIFGAIVLVLSLIVAIIKSHYQEDAAKTSPVGYVYTAIKAVLTFAIVPVTVIAGFWLSSFLLRTLDNITSTVADEETIKGIYGSGADEFVSYDLTVGNNETKKVYTRYDFFSLGGPSSTQTFSGMVFKTAAYNANRVRNGSYTESKKPPLSGNKTHVTGKSLPAVFGQDIPSDVDWQSWVAYQVDYAFANNLDLKETAHITELWDESPLVEVSISAALSPVFVITAGVGNFSKYNVELVWCYYNLWSFNFLVGFAAIILMATIFMNIIFGLMKRLIQCVVLFIIYPATLGLAPLDEFKAFKSWRSNFMKYMLSAFGAIIGTNLLFLVLPYFQNITFITGLDDSGMNSVKGALVGYISLPDLLIQTLIIIVGLNMIKEFIAFFSELVGGVNLEKEGEAAKKAVGEPLVKAGKLAASVALTAATGGMGGMALNMAKKGITTAAAKRNANKAAGKGIAAQHQADELNEGLGQYDNADFVKENKEKAKKEMGSMWRDRANSSKADEWREEAKKKADKKKGLKAGSAEYNKFIEDSVNAKIGEDLAKDKDYQALQRTASDGIKEKDRDALAKRDKYQQEADMFTTRAQNIRTTNFMDKDGNAVPQQGKQMWKSWGKDFGGSILKGLDEGLKNLNLSDVTKKIAGVFTNLSTSKFDDSLKPTGIYGGGYVAAQSDDELQQRKALRKASAGAFGASVAGALFGYGSYGSKEKARATGDKALQEQIDETKKTTTAIEDQTKKFDELIKAIKDSGIAKK